jgi:hypothetical protein
MRRRSTSQPEEESGVAEAAMTKWLWCGGLAFRRKLAQRVTWRVTGLTFLCRNGEGWGDRRRGGDCLIDRSSDGRARAARLEVWQTRAYAGAGNKTLNVGGVEQMQVWKRIDLGNGRWKEGSTKARAERKRDKAMGKQVHGHFGRSEPEPDGKVEWQGGQAGRQSEQSKQYPVRSASREPSTCNGSTEQPTLEVYRCVPIRMYLLKYPRRV